MDSNHRSLSRAIRSILRKVNCGRIDRAAPKFCGVPMVRIHLLPADSPSLSRSHFRASRTRAFPAGVRGSLDDGVSRDAVGFPLRANRRQCLCRAIFQYRSEADAVSGNATTVRTKSGVLGLQPDISPAFLFVGHPLWHLRARSPKDDVSDRIPEPGRYRRNRRRERVEKIPPPMSTAAATTPTRAAPSSKNSPTEARIPISSTKRAMPMGPSRVI